MEIIDYYKGNLKMIIEKELVFKFDEDVIYISDEIYSFFKIKEIFKVGFFDFIKLVSGFLEYLGLIFKFKE